MKRSLLAVLLIGLGGTCLFFVWLKLDVVRMGYAIERLTQKKAAMMREYDSLQLQWSRLTAPQKIALEAKKLGLHAPRSGQVVMVTVETRGTVQQSDSTSPVRVAQNFVQ